MMELTKGDLLILDETEIVYGIIEKTEYNNNTYVLFVNIDNPEDVLIRIEKRDEAKFALNPLKDVEEFDYALKLFSEKLN